MYLLGVVVAIQGRDGANALLGLLQISHSYSTFDEAITSVYSE